MRAAGNAERAPALAAARRARFAAPARDGAHFLQAFGHAVRFDRLPAEPAVALALEILQAEFDRIETERVGDLVDLRLAGERDLRNAEAAERAEAQLVGVGEAAVTMNMRDAVRAAAHQQRIAEHARTVVAEGAAIEQDLDLARDQRAVALDAGLHADLERMARANHFEILFARQDQLDRPFRLHRQQDDDRLNMRLHLVAEAGADLRRQAAQSRHRQPKRFRDIGLHAEYRLVGRPQRDAAVGIHLRERAARFERDMRLRLGLIARFENQVALAPAAFDIAFLKTGARTKIGVRSRVEYLDVIGGVFVNDRGVRRKRLLRRERRRQFLVGHLDRGGGCARQRFGLGGDGGHRLADIADLSLGQRMLVLDERAHAPMLLQIVAGDDRVHARHGGGLRDVVADDARMRVRALQQRAMKHVGTIQIGDILCAAGYLLLRLDLRRRLADGKAERLVHADASAGRRVAASSTASTIFL